MQPRKFLLAGVAVFALAGAGFAGPASAVSAVPVEKTVQYVEDTADYFGPCPEGQTCCPNPPPQFPIQPTSCQPE